MREEFEQELETLIADRAADFEVARHFKQEIKHYFEQLPGRFEEKNGGKAFLVYHTRSIERFIIGLYRYVIRESFGDYLPPVNAIPIALVALGSFGREQLCVYSDLDLMIVYKEIKGFSVKPIIERVLYLAWDAGLKLGHRVHEVQELEAAAATDITIKTALLESRFFYGSRFLWIEVSNQLSHIRHTPGKKPYFHGTGCQRWQWRITGRQYAFLDRPCPVWRRFQ